MAFTYHDLGKNLRLRFMIRLGGTPMVGQSAMVRIRRRSNGEYWNGAAWQVAAVSLPMAEESAVDLPGSYIYDFDHALAGGSTDDYHCYFHNAVPFPNNVVDEETHSFKPGGGGGSGSLGNERRAQPVIAEKSGNLELVFWIEEAGRRVTDYDSLTMTIVDGASNVIVAAMTDVADTADGLFQFVTPVGPITRGVAYVAKLSAVRGLQTDLFNTGFVRY